MISYSQTNQDLFAITLNPEPGYFVDIGCGDGLDDPNGGNTYLLEINGWVGLLVDGDEKLIERAKINRPKSNCINAFFPDSGIEKVFKENNVPKVIDYISIDTDPRNSPTVLALPLDEYEFKIATIEHDKYSSGSKEQEIIYNFLNSKGYTRLCKDIPAFNHPLAFYEDWWVNKKYFPCNKTFYADRFNRQSSYDVVIDLKKDLGQI